MDIALRSRDVRDRMAKAGLHLEWLQSLVHRSSGFWLLIIGRTERVLGHRWDGRVQRSSPHALRSPMLLYIERLVVTTRDLILHQVKWDQAEFSLPTLYKYPAKYQMAVSQCCWKCCLQEAKCWSNAIKTTAANKVTKLSAHMNKHIKHCNPP